VLIERVVAPYFETNCWILAPESGQECVIVDPGIGKPDLVKNVKDKLESHNLKPIAVLITHGQHTKGSVMFTVDNAHLISGDVLFAGSIGRTDLPTGSAQDMKKTLRERILTLPDHLNVLPGHGGQTTIGTERVRNPYLQNDFLNQSGW